MLHVVSKEIGESPLMCINRIKESGLIQKEEKVTYAGRLDPMASGVLLLLTGSDVYEKEKYLSLDKEYEVEVLFGVSTDTGDILGLIKNIKDKNQNIDNTDIQKVVAECVGVFEEEYPNYSSKPVDGKPLFVWARSLIKKPVQKHKVNIKSIDILESRNIEKSLLLQEVEGRIKKVKGDFRQDAIVSKWNDALNNNDTEYFQIIKIKVSSESGAYMRVLAEKIGEKLCVPALAYNINRIKVGNYSLS